MTPGWVSEGLRVAPFGPVALSWQIFQEVTVYAALAMFIYWRRAIDELGQHTPITLDDPAERAGAIARPATSVATNITRSKALLIRCEKEVVPLTMTDIIRIAGADGYSEVIAHSRRILSTTSLARFEEILPSEQFFRAHRSQIVRLAAVKLAEPAGNARLLLHLEDGARITTSRAGAKRLRELTV